jgi:molecular chaperone GrpE
MNESPQEQPEETPKEENELEKLKQEVNEYKNKYLTLLADADNARKRLQKERTELIDYATRNLIIDFLHPIDHFENALKFTKDASSEVKHWALGFQMILNQFKDVLASNGVKPIEAVGKPFDPHFHEAVEMVATKEHPPGIVIEESIRGYIVGDKPLRPARVKVSIEPSEEVSEKK